jgi:serine/arginine repetitive matrix protein 1
LHLLFFKGTSSDQDNRFSDKEKKLLKQMKFSEILNRKVDMTKVKLDVLKPWIATRVTELLGSEDEVVVLFILNQLEEKVGVRKSCIRNCVPMVIY